MSSVDLLFELIFDTPTPVTLTTPGLSRMGPAPPVHPFGSGYSMHPELSRPFIRVLLSAALQASLVPTLVVGTTVGSVIAETAAIESIVKNKSTPSWWKGLVLSGN